MIYLSFSRCEREMQEIGISVAHSQIVSPEKAIETDCDNLRFDIFAPGDIFAQFLSY